MQFNKQDFELFESICEKLGVTVSDDSHQGIIIDGVDGIEFLRDNHIIDFDDPPIDINCMPFNSTREKSSTSLGESTFTVSKGG